MRAYTSPNRRGQKYGHGVGGYCLFFDWVFADTSWGINQTSLHATFL